MSENYRNDIIVKHHYSELIGVSQIIKGRRRIRKHPVTGETIIDGDGELLYSISDKQNKPHFVIVLDKKMGLDKNYLMFRVVENSTIGYRITGTVDTDIYYNLNDSGWVQWDGTDINLNAGDELMVKNNTNTLSNSSGGVFRFVMSGKIKASGDCRSLINFSDLSTNCFNNLFRNCTALLEAPELPATELVNSCYSNMFNGCSNLVKGPILPATELEQYCYSFMFSGCSKLESLTIYYTGEFNSSFNNWMSGVNTEGTLYYDGSDRKKGTSGIPTKWNVVPISG